MTMMPLGEAFYRGRVRAIREQVVAAGAKGILILNMPDVVYASGFVHSPSERPIGLFVPADGEPVLLIPLLEQENAAETWIKDIRVYFEFPGSETVLDWMVAECAVDPLLVESNGSAWWRPDIPRAIPTQIVNRLRWIKQPEELACIRLAAHYADLCLSHVRDQAPPIIRRGGSELDILEASIGATLQQMRHEQGGKYARRLLNVVGTVHSGARAALPHGETSTRTPQRGDTLIAGIGASVGGYYAESGATFIVGQATPEQLRILTACVDCDAAAAAALQVGATCASVNDAALAVLHAAELSDAIRHRIGHGMGLQGHEAPWLAPGDLTQVQPGMVFSSEPGVYRPHVDGYRTINTFIVTDDGVEVPSRFLALHPPEQRILSI
ncbi:MAG: M24 family metallopeptidase [Phototrophicaceae bacterium]|jgi:Xaa-Pro aminopeptidase